MDGLKHLKRAMALAIAAVMPLTAAGCGKEQVVNIMDKTIAQLGMEVVPGERLIGSAWINSDISGALDESVQVSLRDDFHAAVNRDWLIETPVEKGEMISTLDGAADILEEQLIDILGNEGDYLPDEAVMSAEELEHMEQLIYKLMQLAADEAARNELGAEPLRPYIERIYAIDSMEDMNAYLKNEGGANYLYESFINASVAMPLTSRGYYTVHLAPLSIMLMESPVSYHAMSYSELVLLRQKRDSFTGLMGELGYGEDEALAIFSDCYRLERKLAPDLPRSGEKNSSGYIKQADNGYTLEELEGIQGDFPLTGIIASHGLEDANSYTLYEPAFLKALSRMYNKAHLEQFKAYFMVHTVLDAMNYLDVESAEAAERMLLDESGEDAAEEAGEEDSGGESGRDAAEEELLEIADEYLAGNLDEVLQQVYVGRYCTDAMKRELSTFAEEIKDYYVELLSGTEWLGEETRREAVNKLNNIYIHVLYPDELRDFSGLDYAGGGEGGNLLDAIYAIRQFNSRPQSERVDMPMDHYEWNLLEVPTTDVNAFYVPSLNVVLIPAGIVAGDFIYDPEAPLEQNYARLGMIVGHEITHAFDTTGYNYDAEGLENKWWSNDDEVAFRTRANKLANHYSSLSVHPGVAGGYDGALVEGEAIADMGGMKCMLGLAEDIPGFDYEVFFRSYANLFCWKTDLTTEFTLSTDVHPLGFLRTNVTVQQFDEFHETFGVGPGDGMYLAPEDRISVW